jgi:ADP-heptose:LPS heptosyltransferase
LAYGEELPAFDWQCPLLSLPLALQTDLTSIPASKAYVHADPALVRKWSGKLGARQGLRIGIAWSGSTQYSKDYQRSASLTDMLQLRQPGIQLFSLQKSLTEEEQLLVERCADVRHLGEDFSNTAALASLMDVVISVDTSIAHLSAALGCPTWVLLPHTPDWRWMLGREESPWYPTARLFRQSASGGWSPVIDRVGRLLQKMLADADIVLTDFPEEP